MCYPMPVMTSSSGTFAALVALTLVLVSAQLHAENTGSASAGQSKAAVCAVCHGTEGNSSNQDWPNLAGQHAAYLERQMYHFRDGRRINQQMAAMVKDLSDQDIADIASWYASQPIKHSLPNSATAAKRGEKLYRAGNATSGVPACIGCHGPKGSGNPLANYPALAGQHAKYIETQLRQFHEGSRDNDDNAVMRNIAGKMTNSEMRVVSEYISGLR